MHLLWVVVLLFTSVARVQGQTKPDILLILTDDQPYWTATAEYMPLTWSLVGVVGVRFGLAYATTPICCPSRASILTGQYAHNHGALGNVPPLGGAPNVDERSTVATWLKAAGYHTGFFGKHLNYWQSKDYFPSAPPGWDDFRAGAGYYGFVSWENGKEVQSTSRDFSTDVYGEHAENFIRSASAGTPVFVWYAPTAPHFSNDPSQPYGMGFPQPAAIDDGTFDGRVTPWRPPSFAEADVSDKPLWVRRLPAQDAERAAWLLDYQEKVIETMQAVDREDATLVSALQARANPAGFVVIFTTDNGFSMGEHRWERKNCLYESCARVPLWIRAPGVVPRDENDDLVLNIDLAATIAALAGAKPTRPQNGRSLVPLFQNPDAPWRSDFLIEVLGWSPTDVNDLHNFQAVRGERWEYAEYKNGNRELYDLKLDPWQLENRVNNPAYASVVGSLKKRLAVLKSQ